MNTTHRDSNRQIRIILDELAIILQQPKGVSLLDHARKLMKNRPKPAHPKH
jgi:hypothetical protein